MTNPFLSLTPAQIDVLDDMAQEWADKDRHGELNGGWGYGPKRHAAMGELHTLIRTAWAAKVSYRNVEDDDT